MEFLKLIESHLCHGSSNVKLESDRSLECTVCRSKPIRDVYEFISSEKDPFVSCRLAEAYAKWTGDENVPVSYILIDVDGILPSRIIGQPLKSVRESIELFKSLNAPFTENYDNLNTVTELMETFFEKYSEAVLKNENLKNILPSERLVIQKVLNVMALDLKENAFFNATLKISSRMSNRARKRGHLCLRKITNPLIN